MIDEQAPTVVGQATERQIGTKEDAEFPGAINVGGGFFEGHYPGNKLVQFSDRVLSITEQVNAFFVSNPGTVVTGMWFTSDGAMPDGGSIVTAFVLFTRLMSREEAEGINKFSSEVKAKMLAEKAKKLELEALEQGRIAKANQQQADDVKKFVELGKHCAANHKKDK